MFDVTVCSSWFFGFSVQGEGRREWWVRLSAVQTLTGLRVGRHRGGYADVLGLAMHVVQCLWLTQSNPSDETVVTLWLLRTNQMANTQKQSGSIWLSKSERLLVVACKNGESWFFRTLRFTLFQREINIVEPLVLISVPRWGQNWH